MGLFFCKPGQPEKVGLSEAEISKIAAEIGLTTEEVHNKYNGFSRAHPSGTFDRDFILEVRKERAA